MNLIHLELTAAEARETAAALDLLARVNGRGTAGYERCIAVLVRLLPLIDQVELEARLAAIPQKSVGHISEVSGV